MDENMYILILITAKDGQEAERIVNYIIENKLAACANIINGVNSIFWWKGKIDKAEESLILLKTRQDKFDGILSAIKTVHSYICPEVIALPIINGNENYFAWIEDVLT